MEWSGQNEFQSSPEVPFEVDGSEAGLLKSYGPLSFLKVFQPLSMSLLILKSRGFIAMLISV